MLAKPQPKPEISIHALARRATVPTFTPYPARLLYSKSANLKIRLPKMK